MESRLRFKQLQLAAHKRVRQIARIGLLFSLFLLLSVGGIVRSAGERVTFNESSNVAPALTEFTDRLYLAWTGPDRRLNVGPIDFPGSRVQPKGILGDTSNVAPGIAAFAGHLFIAWTGTDGRLNVGWVNLATNRVEDKVILGEWSNAGPALLAWGDFLLIGWTGTDGRLNLGYFNGLLILQRTIDSPASSPSGTAATSLRRWLSMASAVWQLAGRGGMGGSTSASSTSPQP